MYRSRDVCVCLVDDSSGVGVYVGLLSSMGVGVYGC